MYHPNRSTPKNRRSFGVSDFTAWPGDAQRLMKRFMKHPLAILLFFTVVLGAKMVVAKQIPAHSVPFSSLYVFGDSYSDIGAGYVDGNGPTAVAYLADNLKIPFTYPGARNAAGKSLDFAVSGAPSGEAPGKRLGRSILGLGMANQVQDFAQRVRRGSIVFSPESTLFFLAGGLNDSHFSTETTIANLEGEVRTLHALGGKHFMIALLPEKIPAFSAVATRLNPSIAEIPATLSREMPDADIRVSNWGRYFDEVMSNPGKFGIRDTTDACAGRALFREDPTPCAAPDTYFYYHSNHPSTAVHKIVGNMLYNEILAAYGDSAPSSGK
jgi:phospholipase/lecithinase/hemolysin